MIVVWIIFIIGAFVIGGIVGSAVSKPTPDPDTVARMEWRSSDYDDDDDECDFGISKEEC